MARVPEFLFQLPDGEVIYGSTEQGESRPVYRVFMGTLGVRLQALLPIRVMRARGVGIEYVHTDFGRLSIRQLGMSTWIPITRAEVLELWTNLGSGNEVLQSIEGRQITVTRFDPNEFMITEEADSVVIQPK